MDRQFSCWGLPAQPVPRMSPATADLLSRRLAARQVVAAVAGQPLWLPRLGLTVLPHEPITGSWLCTIIAAETQPLRLPVGLWVVDDIEIATALAVPQGWPLALPDGLTGQEFGDAWLVRLVETDYCRYGIAAALLAGFDPDTLIVVADDAARRRAGPSTTPQVFRATLARLRAAGFLAAPASPSAGGSKPTVPPVGAGAAGFDDLLTDFARQALRLSGRPVSYELRLPRPEWPQ
jgi:hypothetical protein